MAAKTNDKVILPGTGTDQQQRVIEALNPDALKLHDFSLADWMKFAFHFAEKVNYFNSQNQKEGTWQDFFPEESKIKELIDNLETDSDFAPHLTLFICFLKLIEISQKHFNQLSKKHLDFYFQKILQIKKQPLVPDKVHVIFELAKNCLPEKIGKSTSLDAGKDKNGNKLIFNTKEELIVNKTSVSQLKNVYHHSDQETKIYRIKACDVANSADGKGKALPSDNQNWYPFGYVDSPATSGLQELPDARLGFALSSPVLLLKEGARTIYLNVVFQKALKVYPDIENSSFVNAYLSGEKKWLGPFGLKPMTKDEILAITGEASKIKAHNSMNFKIELDKSVAPVAAYNTDLLGERFNSSDPVMRFIVDTKSTEGYTFFTYFSKLKLKSISISVDVKGISSLEIENDLGVLNPKKPFFPFGPVPLKGSKFMLKNEEVFEKNWEKLVLDMKWMNKPASLKDQYFAYREKFTGDLTKSMYKSEITTDGKTPPGYIQNPSNLKVKNDNYFKASVEIFSNNTWEGVNNEFLLFNTDGLGGASKLDITNDGFETGQAGQLRIVLNQSFLHELYPRIYAMAMLNDQSTLIPKEPYTPVIESIEMNYTASAMAIFNDSATQKYTGQTVQLFHEHPFGQSEIENSASDQSAVCLLPEYRPGGELYIGLKDAGPLQQISILFQVFEGSENPLVKGFSEGEKLEWDILGSNKWIQLTSNNLISDKTDNLLKSGIVKFSIPAEANKNNTILAPDLYWVRIKMSQPFDSVCKIIDIKSQAVLAEFNNKANELSQLKSGLSASTISKLTVGNQAIKTVTQPYSSFGGSPAESDSAYYQRISERLRHKNRAITLWDYERLILQQFPEIHKVRCLKHTLGDCFFSPGNVTIVVIPDILNKNVFDIYQPRVSRATLNKIQSYINGLNSLHVNAVVINPEYEEVEIGLKAKFYSGYDENYYLKVLQEDLTRLLSPWAYEKTIDLQFDTVLHKSMIINYIEKLEYVDYITNLTVKHKKEIKPGVSPSNPKAILVSARKHTVGIQK